MRFIFARCCRHDFYEAVKELADMTHMDLPESNGKEQELQKEKNWPLNWQLIFITNKITMIIFK